MGLFNFGKKPAVLDLTKRYKEQQEKEIQTETDTENNQSPSQNAFSFLGDLARASKPSEPEEYLDVSGAEDRKKKLAKRLMDLTTKIEDLSNQIYHLQQRVEVLERKSGVRGF